MSDPIVSVFWLGGEEYLVQHYAADRARGVSVGVGRTRLTAICMSESLGVLLRESLAGYSSRLFLRQVVSAEERKETKRLFRRPNVAVCLREGALRISAWRGTAGLSERVLEEQLASDASNDVLAASVKRLLAVAAEGTPAGLLRSPGRLSNATKTSPNPVES